MSKLIDLTGMKFGRLTVLERAENKGKHVRWKCRCDCGNTCTVTTNNLRRSHTTSCGCVQKEKTSAANFHDLTGMKFGRLAVIGLDKIERGRAYFKCQCECGEICIRQGHTLTKGGTPSCGCLRLEGFAKTHGKHNSKAYRIWTGIKTRCFNPNCKAYKNYGGRGITICDEWKDNFQAFYDYVSKLDHFDEEGYSLDRIDNDGNYEPDNVRWATAKEQARNMSRNVLVEYGEHKISLIEASEKTKINYETLWLRTKKGETGEYLLRLPTRKNRK